MNMEPRKLKLGLLLDSLIVPAWAFHALERIAHTDHAEFTIIILNDGYAKDGVTVWPNKTPRRENTYIYDILNKVDEKLFYREPYAFKEMNLEKMLSGVPVMKVKSTFDGQAFVFSPEDSKSIRENSLDILIKLGFPSLGGEILTSAKYGIWFYQHSDNRRIRGGPPGFWEVAERWTQTGATLSIADGCTQNGKAIYRSSFLTYPFSPARNRNISFWVSSSFLPRQIDLLYRLGSEKFFQETAKFNSEFEFYDRKQYHTPTSFDSLKLFARLFGRNLHELYQRAFRLDSWYLMFDLTKSTASPFTKFQKIVPPKDRFWADPHVIQKNDAYFVFIEEYIYKNRKGHISVIEMDQQGHFKDPVPVLETDYHLSYPFVFDHDHKYYMVPESAHNRSIDLYECVEFPFQWKFKMSLMKNLRAVDTTLFFYNGKWWLFTGLAENEGAYPEVELFLFYSDELFTTEWKSHPLNPVVSDVSSARPAGNLFEKNGKLYRPSQDCSKNYGYGFNISEIQCLNETNYLEIKVAVVKPEWEKRLVATHTYTNAGGLVVIDALIRRGKYL